MFVVGLLFTFKNTEYEKSIIVSECTDLLNFSEAEKLNLNNAYSYTTDFGRKMGFIFLLSLNLCVLTIYSIYQLKRTAWFGYMVIMIQEMLMELRKFLTTFGLIILIFFLGLRIMNLLFKKEDFEIYKIILDAFNIVLGVTNLNSFHYYEG